MAGNVTEVTEQTFESSVLKSDKPVLVDFWAPWCGPCRAIAPMVEELSGEYQGKVGFAKLNTDDNQRIAMQLGIMSIPTLVVFQNGKEVSRLVGVRPKADLKRAIDSAVAAAA
jgi:thioredoxin 1